MSDNKVDLINKLKRLMQSDNEHESKSAEKKLHKIMEKYNIDESALNELQTTDYYMWFHNDYEKKLLHQICYKVFGNDAFSKIYQERFHRGKRIKLILRCTYEEYLEVSIQYDFYKQLMYEELDVFMDAFIYKHNMFPSGCESKDEMDLTEEEIEKIQRAMAMTKGMKDKDYVVRIGEVPNEDE